MYNKNNEKNKQVFSNKYYSPCGYNDIIRSNKLPRKFKKWLKNAFNIERPRWLEFYFNYRTIPRSPIKQKKILVTLYTMKAGVTNLCDCEGLESLFERHDNQEYKILATDSKCYDCFFAWGQCSFYSIKLEREFGESRHYLRCQECLDSELI